MMAQTFLVAPSSDNQRDHVLVLQLLMSVDGRQTLVSMHMSPQINVEIRVDKHLLKCPELGHE